jgi:microsomal dipeptidase-like Zn-dependent dipeptidase
MGGHVYPVIDLHCDLLSYLADAADAHPDNVDDTGCALPRLKQGNVVLQVLAIYSGPFASDAGSVARQIDWFRRLSSDANRGFCRVRDSSQLDLETPDSSVACIAAIEGATALCSDTDDVTVAFTALDALEETTGGVLYIGFTHHGSNRFGGGNVAGGRLTADGKALLEYLDGRGIAVDLSHASDAFAHDILDHVDRRHLELPVMASHSNFRVVRDHPRNLPDDLAVEIINRGGLIGINFLREVVDPTDPAVLEAHIRHGMRLGGDNALCFGADFFFTAGHPDRSREPFFFAEHEHAGRYPEILHGLESAFGRAAVERIAWRNALAFIERTWHRRR